VPRPTLRLHITFERQLLVDVHHGVAGDTQGLRQNVGDGGSRAPAGRHRLAHAALQDAGRAGDGRIRGDPRSNWRSTKSGSAAAMGMVFLHRVAGVMVWF
jgi:hypothetical protein